MEVLGFWSLNRLVDFNVFPSAAAWWTRGFSNFFWPKPRRHIFIFTGRRATRLCTLVFLTPCVAIILWFFLAMLWLSFFRKNNSSHELGNLGIPGSWHSGCFLDCVSVTCSRSSNTQAGADTSTTTHHHPAPQVVAYSFLNEWMLDWYEAGCQFKTFQTNWNGSADSRATYGWCRCILFHEVAIKILKIMKTHASAIAHPTIAHRYWQAGLCQGYKREKHEGNVSAWPCLSSCSSFFALCLCLILAFALFVFRSEVGLGGNLVRSSAKANQTGLSDLPNFDRKCHATTLITLLGRIQHAGRRKCKHHKGKARLCFLQMRLLLSGLCKYIINYII